MSQRLMMLEKLVIEQHSSDPFAWYGLAMEYRQLGRVDESLATFTTLRKNSPDYLPMYLMAGQLLIDQERSGDAKEWLDAGLKLAREQGNAKAESEISDALTQC